MLLTPLARPWGVVLLVVMTGVVAGCRYVVEVSPKGIRLTFYSAWVVPTYRRRYLRDVEVELYESFEAGGPQGLCLLDRHPSDGGEAESEVFATFFDRKRMEGEREVISAAIQAARSLATELPLELRHRFFGALPWAEALPISKAKRDEQNRIREITSTKGILFGKVTIPAGSTFFFNDDPYIDPQREDRLVKIMLGAPTKVAGVLVKAKATLMFDARARLSSMRGAFDGEIEMDGNWVDGREIISFDAEGFLSSFTLSRQGRAAGYTIPARSRWTRWPGDKILPAHWSCWLGGSLVLPDITLRQGERIELSIDGRRITAIAPSGDVELGGVTLKGGIMAFPLGKDGRVDVEKCRQLGLVKGASQRT